MVYCFIYSKKGINAISLFITIIVYLCLSFAFANMVSGVKIQAQLVEMENIQEYLEYENWYLKIPKIDLYAEIREGTDMETLNQYIGHFTETNVEEGNIGLAAHNRGYEVNYFERLKELKPKDEIYYSCNGKEAKCIVQEKGEILETDWSKLEKTCDTNLTLITCLENKPDKRLYLRANLEKEN